MSYETPKGVLKSDSEHVVHKDERRLHSELDAEAMIRPAEEWSSWRMVIGQGGSKLSQPFPQTTPKIPAGSDMADCRKRGSAGKQRLLGHVQQMLDALPLYSFASAVRIMLWAVIKKVPEQSKHFVLHSNIPGYSM